MLSHNAAVTASSTCDLDNVSQQCNYTGGISNYCDSPSRRRSSGYSSNVESYPYQSRKPSESAPFWSPISQASSDADVLFQPDPCDYDSTARFANKQAPKPYQHQPSLDDNYVMDVFNSPGSNDGASTDESSFFASGSQYPYCQQPPPRQALPQQSAVLHRHSIAGYPGQQSPASTFDSNLAGGYSTSSSTRSSFSHPLQHAPAFGSNHFSCSSSRSSSSTAFNSQQSLYRSHQVAKNPPIHESLSLQETTSTDNIEDSEMDEILDKFVGDVGLLFLSTLSTLKFA
uniref:Uncharacterized protein n=1 Tax=Panagrellus redivivus TaxID=6233 RepID=A0A7E4W651_PANRE